MDHAIKSYLHSWSVFLNQENKFISQTSFQSSLSRIFRLWFLHERCKNSTLFDQSWWWIIFCYFSLVQNWNIRWWSWSNIGHTSWLLRKLFTKWNTRIFRRNLPNIISESKMVLIRWAMVSVVACLNSDRIVFCNKLSVSISIAAVASSSTKTLEFDKSARPKN